METQCVQRILLSWQLRFLSDMMLVCFAVCLFPWIAGLLRQLAVVMMLLLHVIVLRIVPVVVLLLLPVVLMLFVPAESCSSCLFFC